MKLKIGDSEAADVTVPEKLDDCINQFNEKFGSAPTPESVGKTMCFDRETFERIESDDRSYAAEVGMLMIDESKSSHFLCRKCCDSVGGVEELPIGGLLLDGKKACFACYSDLNDRSEFAIVDSSVRAAVLSVKGINDWSYWERRER